MSSVILSALPAGVTRNDVLSMIQDIVQDDDLKYLLFPLGKDSTKALVAFKTAEGIIA